jgi:ELWxxDGT repeat protein
MFADIRAGIWGSYPLNLTPSGNTLFFSADNGHGYELYATDGTPGSAHLVKDIKPGLGGSNPGLFWAADNGVVYFAADDGTGRALWRSDGTAAGTTKVPGMPANANPDLLVAVGRGGQLYFTTGNTLGNPTGSGQPVEWWMTDGTTTTLLHTFTNTAGISTRFDVIDGQVVLVRQHAPFEQPESMWKTDGTPGGTRLWQPALTGFDVRTGPTLLTYGTQIAPGKFVHASMELSGVTTSLWVSDGVNPGSVTLLAVLDTPSAHAGVAGSVVVGMGGKAYAAVRSTDPRVAGLWVTDGTVAGTHKSDLPVGSGPYTFGALTPFYGRLLIQSGDGTTGYRFYLTDGSAAGTVEVPRPTGVTTVYLDGLIPPGPGEPRGAVLLRANSPQGPLFRSDGTAAGTAWVDPTGLPSGYRPVLSDGFQNDGLGRVIQPYTPGGVYFNGGLYFPAADGDQRSELWKWDAGAPTGQVVAPQVLGVTVNDGSAQRSVVTSLTITFDRDVNVGDGALTLTDANGKSYLLSIEDPVSGSATVSVDFGGGSLPDGRYTLTVKAGRVTDAATGGALAADYTFGFTRLFGDLNGDGTYDRQARVMVHNAIGLHVGDAGYLAALDCNADGVIDSVDELAVVRNWGKSV